jgi:hypothetical protein
MREGVKRRIRGLRILAARCDKLQEVFLSREKFETRHIGPRQYEQVEMLKVLGIKVRNDFLFDWYCILYNIWPF